MVMIMIRNDEDHDHIHLYCHNFYTTRLPCIVDRLEGFVMLWKKNGEIITVASQIIDKVTMSMMIMMMTMMMIRMMTMMRTMMMMMRESALVCSTLISSNSDDNELRQ